MSGYEGDADLAASFDNKFLEMRLANRIKCDRWDGNPRKCRTCGREIEVERLKAINATQCKSCVQQMDWEDD